MKFMPGLTLKGFIGGSILYGIFILAPAVILFEHLYPTLNSAIIFVSNGLFIGLSLSPKFKMISYWHWADKKMSKFMGIFGYNTSE